MLRHRFAALLIVVLLICPSIIAFPGAVASAAPAVKTGEIGGVAYKIEVPDPWNGTLVLYSHGSVFPGDPNPAADAPNAATGAYLLGQGYALAGSAYRRTGWSLDDAFTDQPALLDFFATQYGAPKRTIAWGTSLGGMITAGLLQKFPTRFAAGLPMCGLLGGGVAQWNLRLDSMFVLKTLIAPNADLPLVHLTDPAGSAKQAEALINQAQTTPAGRARIAFAAAVWNTPGWFDRLAPEPAATDYAAREQAQLQWTLTSMFPYAFVRHAELESRAGGNPAWNTGVDYRQLLAGSVDAAEVAALYQTAGIKLDDDLTTLAQAPRITNDPQATAYLAQNILYNGQIAAPVLSLHTIGDGQQPVQQEQAYADVVNAAGHGDLLRQVFIHRAGHCAFTSGEMIAAFQHLVNRLDTGAWNASGPTDQLLNAAANALDPGLNTLSGADNKLVATPAAFAAFQPTAFLRPFDARSQLPAVPAPNPVPAPAPGPSAPQTGGAYFIRRLGDG